MLAETPAAFQAAPDRLLSSFFMSAEQIDAIMTNSAAENSHVHVAKLKRASPSTNDPESLAMRCLALGLRILVALAIQVAPVFADGVKPDSPEMWSSAFERFLARRYTYWLAANDGVNAEPDRQFIIVCDPDNPSSYIRSLRHLSVLREEYVKDRKDWGAGRSSQYPCIGANSFRLPLQSSAHAARPSDRDDPGVRGAFHKVVQDDPNHQVVELRFRDLNAGIYDSYFKYEVRANSVAPLESWVVSRGVMPMLLVELSAVSLLVLLAYGTFRLLRLLHKRRGGR